LEAEGKDRGVVWDDNLDLDSAEEHPYMQLNPDALFNGFLVCTRTHDDLPRQARDNSLGT
jgi:hypothetical protein